MTPLFVVFQKRINDCFEQLRRNQLDPWIFLNSGKPMKVETFHKKQISYEGVGFEGSPSNVFWSNYIEPFMEDIIVNEINAAVEMCVERKVDTKELLGEMRGLFLAGIGTTFIEMAKLDQRLLGKGFPEKIQLRSIEKEHKNMVNFIDIRIQSELEIWQQKSKFETWYLQNKSIIWLISIVFAILGLLANFI